MVRQYETSRSKHEFQLPRVRVELIFEISPHGHAVLTGRKCDIEVVYEPRHDTANLHHRKVLPDAIVAPWCTINVMSIGYCVREE